MSIIKIGDNLKELRIQKGLSRQQISKELFISRQSYTNYEEGKQLPSLDLLIQIAEYFGIPLPELIFGPNTYEDLIGSFPEECHEFLRIYIALPVEMQQELLEHVRIMKKYRK